MNNFLKTFRFFDWIHYIGFVLLGSLMTKNPSLILFLQAPLMLAYAYSINDYYDNEDERKYFLIPLILSLLLASTLEVFQIGIYLIFIFIFTLYSWPKTSLQGKPVISTLSNSIGFLCLFLLPFKGINQVYSALYLVAIILLLNTAAQLIHEMVHRNEDGKKGKITTAVKTPKGSLFGIKASLGLSALISLSFIRNRPLVSIPTIVLSAYFILKPGKDINKKSRKIFKYSGIICGIFYLFHLI